ncbi:TonB-dependent receptor [Pacificimonas sp. WHA3]|uniref:TonB-dependent receptor n=1 Tax=Pacificimonas pallii TaxID=2827236 RepID=A0ABS6SFF8_9SPHN|nr:TonB-dependent receptor [Pacificimonas pallii]MBV7257134.1 TonB-dependent receptor [Pacificimonas pallii]
MEKRLAFAMAAGGILSALSAPTYAQAEDASGAQAGAADTDQGGVIVVTASRRSESLQDAPLAISVIDSETFVDSGLVSIEDILDYTPGANVTSDGATGQGQIILRAISQESSVPVTAVYLDDVPLTSATPFAAAADYFLDGIMGELERVEVLKGPQGTLYGAGAMGGVVRYVTRDPALSVARGSFSADLSSTKNGGLTQLYRGVVSMPIVEDRIGLTVGGFWNDRGGYIDRLDPETLDIVEKDYNTSRNWGGNAASLFEMSDRASLKVTGMYQKNRTRGNNRINLTAPAGTSPVYTPVEGRLSFAAYEPADVAIVTKKADATFKLDLDWAEFTSVTGFSHYEATTTDDQGNDPSTLISLDVGLGLPIGTTTSVPAIFYSDSDRFTQELRLVSQGMNTVDWILGAFYVKENTSNSQLVVAQPYDLTLFDVDFPATYEEIAIYGDVTYNITPNFDVTGGLRFSHNDFESDFDFSGLLIGAVDLNSKTSDDVLTYLFNARFRPSDDLSLYVRIASGYRPGNVNVPITDLVTGRTASSVIESDSLWSYEVGAKGWLADGRIRYDLALWYVDWSNFQAAVEINGIGTSGNAGVGMQSYGFEASADFEISDNFSLVGTLAHAKGELGGDSLELGGLKGEQTRFIPEWTGSLRAKYDYEIGSLDGNATLGARYVGEYTTVYRGGFSQALMQNVGFGEIEFPIDDYVLVDLSASITSGRVTFTAYATNLLNEYAYSNAGADDTGLGVYLAGAGVVEPRRIGGSIKFAF